MNKHIHEADLGLTAQVILRARPSERIDILRPAGPAFRAFKRIIDVIIAVAALPLADGSILMAMNDNAGDASVLRLAVSRDQGNSWRVIRTLEHDGGDARYPMLRRLEGGEIALTYSHATKRGIRAYVLNDAWVAAQ